MQTYCNYYYLLQVFAIEFVAFAIEFVGFAIEFVAFALQFVTNKASPRNQLFIKRRIIYAMESYT